MVKCVGRKSCIVHRVTNTSNESRVRCLLLLLLTSYFLLLTFGFAQDGGIPGALLNYGMSPRTIAMGKAFTGLADDQEAAYYNPAGLTQLLSHNIKTSYLPAYGAQLGYFGYALPTRKFGSFGFSMIYLGSNDIDSRDANGNYLGTFGVTQNCFTFSYAFQPFKPIGFGANLKLMTSKVAQYGTLGMGGDLGLFLFPRGKFTFGITCQNLFGPKLKHNNETDEVPITLRSGVGLKLYQDRITIAVDLVKTMLEYTSPEYHVGMEFIPVYPTLVLRGGVDRNCVSFGVGVNKDWNKFSLGIDYAAEFHYASSYLLPHRHKIGIVINFAGFRTWVDASPKQFSPSPGRKENIAWLDVHYNTKRKIERWQLLIKNQYGELVRTFSGWDAPPLRLSWDGLDDIGRVSADGKYYYEILLVDEIGETIEFSDFLTKITTLGPEGEIEFLPQE
ncbi:hypothetical protein ES707_10514 [subsurface metagenome]